MMDWGQIVLPVGLVLGFIMNEIVGRLRKGRRDDDMADKINSIYDYVHRREPLDLKLVENMAKTAVSLENLAKILERILEKLDERR